MGITVNDVSGIGAVANLATDLVDRIFPDKVAQASERSAYLLKAEELDNQINAGQAAIDLEEAKSNSFFVSGARPFIMWTCGVIFAYHFMLLPLIMFGVTAYNSYHGTTTTLTLPTFDIGMVKDTLFGLLGIYGTQRTVEKMGDKGHLPWQQ